MRHGPDIRGQSSTEPPLISRPPIQASPPSIQSYGGWSVEDIASRRSQTNNNLPSVSVKESNAVKSDKHLAQQKPFSHNMAVSAPNASLSQTSQVKVEEVCS